MSKSQNIHYRTDTIVRYYSRQRITWNDFYPSEKWIFAKVAGAERNMGRVLDVGCAAGGLGMALSEQFIISEYVGVDINTQAIELANAGKTEYPIKNCQFFCSDILDLSTQPFIEFDNVISLSCADWNICTHEIINVCWKHVREGGNFILTLRLTPHESLYDVSESYQYIWFDNPLPIMTEGIEKAAYIVMNIKDALMMLTNLQPPPINLVAYGYWGSPSFSARTKYDKLVFTAFALKKGIGKSSKEGAIIDAHLPVGLFL